MKKFSTKAYPLSLPILSLLSFFLPATCYVLICACSGVAPFGDHNLLVKDLNWQYVDFLTHLQTKDPFSSLFFSWNIAMGSSYLPLFAYYVSSPFSLITLFFLPENMPLGIGVMTLCKLGCASVFFALFLRNRFQKSTYMHLLFATCYALMSYNIIYASNIMWLDGVIWLPMILLSVDVLIQRHHIRLFVFSLSMAIFSNFYTAYMAFLFAICYALLRCFGEENMQFSLFLQKLGKAALGTLLSVGLTALLTFPTVLYLLGGRMQSEQSVLFESNFHLVNFIFKFFPGMFESFSNSMPIVFVSTFVTFSCLLFWVHPHIGKRQKIATLLVYAFLFVSFWLSPLNLFWHAMLSPTGFPYRYAFVFGCMSLYTTACVFHAQRLETKRELCMVFLLLLLCFAVVFFFPSRVPRVNWLITIITLVLLFGCFSWRQSTPSKASTLCLFVIVIIELLLSAVLIMDNLHQSQTYRAKDEYPSFVQNVSPLVETANELSGDDFFRMEKDFYRSTNDNMTLGIRGASLFSSTYQDALTLFFDKLGLYRTQLSTTYHGATPLTDSLFSMRYLLLEREAFPSYEPIQSINGKTLYENPYALPLLLPAYGSKDISLQSDALHNQETLLKTLVSYEGSVWTEVIDISTTQVDEQNVSYTFVAPVSGVYYIAIDYVMPYTYQVNERAPSDVIYNYVSQNKTLGFFKQGEEIAVTYTYINAVEARIPCIYALDNLKFDALMSAYTKELPTCTVSKNQITASIQASTSPAFLFTSIPYDEGWQVTLNGQSVQTEMFADVFLSVPLVSGENDLVLTYTPKGFSLGLWFSSLTLFSLLGWFIYQVFFQKRKHHLH